MKVLQVSHHFWPCIGGIEKFAMDLSKALEKNGIETKVVCLNKCAKSKEILKEKEIVEKIDVERIPFIDLGYYKIAPKILEKTKGCDLVHVHNLGFFSDYLAITKFLHKKPLILNTHGGIFHTRKLGVLKKVYFGLFQKFFLKKFDIVIADSKADFELFSKIVQKEKLVLIENAIDLEKFYNSKKEKIPNTFVFVGRFSKNKKISDLIGVFSEIAKKGKEFSLKIVGIDFDNLKKEIFQEIEEKGLGKNIQIIENLPEKDLAELLAKTRFFVSASEYEGFGISAIEAMASECIPLLNNIENFNTIIESNANGKILEFKNHEKTAKEIVNLMDLPKESLQKMSQASLKSTKRFSLKSVIKRYTQEYEKVVK